MTFWDHLDALRSVLIRCIIAVVLTACIVFCFKDELFAIVFAPRFSPLLQKFFADTSDIHIINTELTRQFIVHMKVSIYAGMLIVAPYIIYQLYGFVLPALLNDERRYSTPFVIAAYIMFMLGVCFSYFVLFPLTFRFLGSYQVEADVQNLISLQSYIDTLLFLCLTMGISFELPILSWLLGRLGLIHQRQLQQLRRHAFVAVLVVAAIITPTTDAFTLTLVALPMYLLYELSILMVPKKRKNKTTLPIAAT